MLRRERATVQRPRSGAIDDDVDQVADGDPLGADDDGAEGVGPAQKLGRRSSGQRFAQHALASADLCGVDLGGDRALLFDDLGQASLFHLRRDVVGQTPRGQGALP